MAEDTHCVRDNVNVCQLCGQLENLSLCGECKRAWYCCKLHQRQDWKKHKDVCKRGEDNYRCIGENGIVSTKNGNAKDNSKSKSNGSKELMFPSTDDGSTKVSASASSTKTEENTSNMHGGACCRTIEPDELFSKNDVNIAVANTEVKDVNLSGCERDPLQVHISTKAHGSTKSSKKKKKSGSSASNGPQQRYYLDQTTNSLSLPPSISELPSSEKQTSTSKTDMGREDKGCPAPTMENREQYLLILQSRFNEVTKYVVKCLIQYGICVVDKFLGDATAEEILKEVINLKTSGLMNQGQLVNGPASSSKNKHIRGDIITWIDGTEQRSKNIHYLISCMDTVMLEGAKQLENCVINERTKAMVACYPGGATGYVRHVDNPSGDGRCITCIYYLNKDWDVRRDGGLLRIHPEGLDRVANIEPICDRLLFFWSDRRNPHEVERTLRERYAITVWYYDADERAQALKRLKDHHSNEANRSPVSPISK